MIVVEPSAVPCTVKVAVVLPALTVRLEGIVTIPLGLLNSVRFNPAAGAGRLRLTVPLIERVNPTVPKSSDSVITGTATFTVALADVYPGADAVMVALPTLPGVTDTTVLDRPCGMVVLETRLATPESLLLK